MKDAVAIFPTLKDVDSVKLFVFKEIT